MIIKYDGYIENVAVEKTLKRLTNQIYKLLPNREENLEWEKPLKNIMEELTGMDNLLVGKHDILFPLLCKLEGLFSLTEEDDFLLYRRTIFESLSLIDLLIKKCRR